MAEWVTLKADDGHELKGYVARPTGEPKAALVLVQEIFGVNSHIQAVTDEYAAEGFLVIAPAMFDRYQHNFDVNYDEAGWAAALGIAGKIDFDNAVKDVDAALGYLHTQTDKPVGIVGYCFGGSMAWLASCRLKVDAAVGYYGSAIINFVNEEPQAPIMLHFGGLDEHIGPEKREAILKAHPEVPLFVYDNADHAFNRKADPSAYVDDAAELAKKRTLQFFAQHLGF